VTKKESDSKVNGRGSLTESFDVLVIGGGPAGLTAALYCRTHNLRVIVIEGRKLGGQLSQLYPTKFILNYASYPEIRAGYLADLMIHHTKYKEVELVEKQVVTGVEKMEGIFHVTTGPLEGSTATEGEEIEKEYLTRSIIIASGMGMFEPSRLNVPGEDEFEGKGVYYAVPNIEIYRGKRVMVIGGGDTAVEDAVGLAGIANVTLVHRRNKFRATEVNLDLLSKSTVEVKTPFTLQEIKGKKVVEGIVLKDVKTGELEEMKVDSVIINVGFSPDLSLIKELGIEHRGNQIVIQNTNMHTNVEGIFACGDIVDYPGKVKQIHPALGEASIAAEEAYRYLKKPYWAEDK